MVVLRNMKIDDLDFLMEMVTTAGWNQIDQDWIRYISLEPNGCFVAEENGEPVGTATTVCYEDEVGWIGMVIVKPSIRGKGIGKALINNCINYLKIRVETIKLDATPMGEPLYTKLGFKPEYRITRLETHVSLDSDQKIFQQIPPINEIIRLDKNAFGANREKVLKQLFAEYLEYYVFEKTANDLSGYAIANRGQHHWHIGPLIAHDDKVAKRLMEQILQKLNGKQVYMDVPNFSGDREKLFVKFGFQLVRSYTRMYLGTNNQPGNIEKIFATARAEKG
jgi:GNAT superfamily N-acetyltransferase